VFINNAASAAKEREEMEKYDCIYYYVGGTERGIWRECSIETAVGIEAQIESIERSGYFALRGNRSIGAPEGPPHEILDGDPIPDVSKRYYRD
jgi:hypothetical protein